MSVIHAQPRSLLLALALILPVTALAGCVCSPEDVPAVVTIHLVDEEVRTLPIITSGATRVAGIALPDTHGILDFRVNVSHNLSSVDIRGLSLGIRVAGVDLPTKVLKVEGGQGDLDGSVWNGFALDGERLRFYWAVDRDQISTLTSLVLSEGATYEAIIDFAWKHESCAYRASGQVRETFEDFVEASVNARTFATRGEPFLETSATGAGVRVDYGIVNGLDVEVERVTAKAVYIAAAKTGGVGLVAFPTVGTEIDGEPATRATPRDALRAQSTGTALAQGGYATSGTFAPTGLIAGAGLYVLLVDITYNPTDPTLGVDTDTFAYAVMK